jgi:formylglycine-generating enzyme required for sulfatase activity
LISSIIFPFLVWKRWATALDRLPPQAGLPLGLGLGALAGALLLLAPVAVWVPAFLLLFVAAGVLAWSGEPVEVLPVAEPLPAPPVTPAAGIDLIEMVAIPAGTFLMGSPAGEDGRYVNEGPVHEVVVSAFQCMKTPVTRRLYAAVLGTDPGWPEGEADDRPVNNVTWSGAIKFCNQLSKREGLTPCYEHVRFEVIWHREADGYRLPTEAEWEYACRAGTQTRWSVGDDEARLADHAWYDANAEGNPHPVGQKLPNPWGLHDMHGNVWEWCWDRYGAYEPGFAQDPAGSLEGSDRLARGGSFLSLAGFLRSAIRVRGWPEGRGRGVGFRCVRGPRRQP